VDSQNKAVVASDDKVVSTTIAKREWFLKSSDLVTLPRFGGGAAWGVGRFPIKYCTKDLDSLALRIHGVFGLARKRAARAKRLENNETKTEAMRGSKRGRDLFGDENVVVEEEVEEVKFSRKLHSRSATRRKWNTSDVVESLHDSDEEVDA
jgi:hypothetical protein